MTTEEIRAWTPEQKQAHIEALKVKTREEHRNKKRPYLKQWYLANREYAKEQTKQRYYENREECLAYAKSWRTKNSDRLSKLAKKKRRENPRHYKSKSLKKNFGITLEQRDEMLAAQGGVCAICCSSYPGPKDWHTDHKDNPDMTKTVRGILCYLCNPGIGYFNHNPALLIEAASYLVRSHPCQETTANEIRQAIDRLQTLLDSTTATTTLQSKSRSELSETLHALS